MYNNNSGSYNTYISHVIWQRWFTIWFCGRLKSFDDNFVVKLKLLFLS